MNKTTNPTTREATRGRVSKNRLKKQTLVEELKVKAGKAKALVFTNYQGLTHKQLEDLKKAIKPLKAEFVVAKNKLLAIALSGHITKEQSTSLKGPTGTMFIYEDIMEPLKQLSKTIKSLGIPSVKFGIMDKEMLTSEQILKLATLPSREVLLAQLVVTLKAPIYALHRSLNWNLQRFALTLKAVEKTKIGGEVKNNG